MDELEHQRQTLTQIRALLGRFVRAEIDATTFIPSYAKLFGPFDATDMTTTQLTDVEQAQLELFIRFMGGWFGEDYDLVPKRTDWEYGKCDQPYGWIDEAAYRRWISSATHEAGITLPSS